MLRFQIGLQLWKIWMQRWKLIVPEKLLERLKISSKGIIGYFELKKHTP
jgi:hypothetical protein